MSNNSKTRGDTLKRQRRLAMISVAIGGVVTIIGAGLIGNKFWHDFALHLGTAAIVAAALGFSIDYWLKREIAEDAVKVAIGYFLPEQIKPEMADLFELKILCEKLHQQVEIKRQSDGVEVHGVVRRTLRNITDRKQEVHLTFGPDEWLVLGRPTLITEIGYRHGGKEFVGEQAFEFGKVDRTPGLFAKNKALVFLEASQTLEFWYRYIEHRTDNAVHYFVYRYPISRPEIQVTAPPEIDWDVTFGHPKKGSRSATANAVMLDATLLPYQGIYITWWDKGAGDRWRNRDQSKI